MKYYIIANCKFNSDSCYPAFSTGDICVLSTPNLKFSPPIESFYVLKGSELNLIYSCFNLEDGKKRLDIFCKAREIYNCRLISDEDFQNMILMKDIIE